MDSNDTSATDKKLLRVIVWCSAIAVGGCFALLFGFQRSGSQMTYEFNVRSLIAFVVGLVLTALFWRKVFTLIDTPKKMWRFIIVSAVLFVVAFVACVFLPWFAPAGGNKGELLQGMLLGFAVVAGVFYLARTVMRLMENADSGSEDGR